MAWYGRPKGERKGVRNKKAKERRAERNKPTQAQIEAKAKMRKARADQEEIRAVLRKNGHRF